MILGFTISARQDGGRIHDCPKGIAPNGRLPTRFGRASASPNRAEAEREKRAARSEPHRISKGEPWAGCYALYEMLFILGRAPNARRARRGHGRQFFNSFLFYAFLIVLHISFFVLLLLQIFIVHIFSQYGYQYFILLIVLMHCFPKFDELSIVYKMYSCDS